MNFDPIIYGKSNETGLVDVHILRDDPEKDECWMLEYYRSKDGKLYTKEQRLYPFFYLSDINLIKGYDESKFKWVALKGNNYYKYLCVFYSIDTMWDALNYIGKDNKDKVYRISSPETMYLMQTGKTLFKGLEFNSLHRLQFDIETYSPNRFPDSSKDPIIIIAVSDNRGLELLLCNGEDKDNKPKDDKRIWFDTEADMLQYFIDLVKDVDPDILEVYNGMKFDIPYIKGRCDALGIDFNLSRDGSEHYTRDSSIRFAERKLDYPFTRINGRHIIDGYFQVLYFDVIKRAMPSHTLKAAAKYFGIAPKGRTYVEGKDIWWTWDEDPNKLLDYALDDVYETRKIIERLATAAFYTTMILPMTYQKVSVTGNGAKIESLFVREYLRVRESLPKPEVGQQEKGGYTKVFYKGVFGPISYADVESLYPSIMIQYKVQPERDHIKVFSYCIQRLTQLRLETKQMMREAKSNDEKQELDGRQSSYKILINCFDPETDVLTVDGLKNIKDICVGDLVYSINPETRQRELKPVTHVWNQKYQGDMIRIKDRNHDLLVTPEHRFLVRNVWGRDLTWKTAEELYNEKKRVQIPTSWGVLPDADFDIDIKDFCDNMKIPYKINGDRIKEDRNHSRWIPRYFNITKLAKLCGLYISEGSSYIIQPKDYGYTKRGKCYRVTINQKENGFRDYVEENLKDLGLFYSSDVNGFHISNRIIYEFFVYNFGKESENKKIPSWCFNLPPDALEKLWEGLMMGDGDKDGGRYTTKSLQLAKDFIHLGHKLNKNVGGINQDSGVYRVYIRQELKSGYKSISPNNITKEQYDGNVYCITVADNHTVLAGRNGLLNWTGQSFYGILSDKHNIFNDFSEGERVASTGREIINIMIDSTRKRGGKVIEADTDGILFVPPPHVYVGENREDTPEGMIWDKDFVAEINKDIPEGIKIGFDGRYKKMFSYAAKNYALLDFDNKIKIKGGSFKNRKEEKFGREFVSRCLKAILNEDIDEMHKAYIETLDKIERRNWTVEDFEKTETLNDTLEEYQWKLKNTNRNKAASYELALKMKKRKEPIGKGDRINYYIASLGKKKVPSFEAAKLSSEWNPEKKDEDTKYYVNKLKDFAAKFEEFFDSWDYKLIFNREDLFGFTSTGIKIKEIEVE